MGDKLRLEVFFAYDISILNFLPHCNVDQLMHVEKCSKSIGRDVSIVTDKLWKKFQGREFLPQLISHFQLSSANVVVQSMRERKVWLKWETLYEAILKETVEFENKVSDRIRQLYKKENERKLSRQLKVCEVVKPITKKEGMQ